MRYKKMVFEEVTLKAVKRWKDESGKSRQKTRKFFQTLNPWNTKGGRPKTRDEILMELSKERDAWMKSNEG